MRDMLILIGASGHGNVLADIAIKMNKWHKIAFLDDDYSVEKCMGFDVVGTSDDIDKYVHEADFFVAIGKNNTREKVQGNLIHLLFSQIETAEEIKKVVVQNVEKGIVDASQQNDIEEYMNKNSLVNYNAVIGEDVSIEKGTVVMAGAIINSSTRIGKGCIINTGSIIEHDNIIEDYVHISPGSVLSGTVKIGRGSWIGARSVVSNNIEVSNGCIVGAGAVVVKDLPANCTAVGAPAKPIKFSE